MRVLQIGSAGGSSSSAPIVHQQHVPIIRVSQPGAPQDNMPIVSAEEVVVQENLAAGPTSTAVPTTVTTTRDRRYRASTKKSGYCSGPS